MVCISLALAGLTAGGASATTTPALGPSPATDLSAQVSYFSTDFIKEVTAPVTREAIGVRPPNVETAARKDAAAREAARQLAARQLAAKQLAARQLAAKQLAAAKAAAAAAAARAAAAESQHISRYSSRTPIQYGDPRFIARGMLASYGWALTQFDCLDSLWMRESGWRITAENSSSGAYGIPQALPGSKMGTVAADWRTNPTTQITWGLRYIKGRYGSPCGAWAHFESSGWY